MDAEKDTRSFGILGARGFWLPSRCIVFMLYYILGGIALLGAFLDFVAICLLQTESRGSGTFNPLGLMWWLFFLEFMWAISFLLLVFKDRLRDYRLFFLGLTVWTLSNIPSEIHGSLVLTVAGRSADQIKAGGALRAAGLIILIFPMIVTLLLVGSEPDAEVNQVAQSLLTREKPLPTPQSSE
jgi:hypothetical protein